MCIINFSPDSDDAVDEWAMVELQGDLETRVKDDSLIDKFIGHLHFTKQVNTRSCEGREGGRSIGMKEFDNFLKGILFEKAARS